MSFIESGKQQGAKVLIGGGRATEGELAKGAYVLPTVFSDCTDQMAIVQEEIFGPVLAVTTFKDFDDAIKIANDTMYGLGAGVWSRSAHISYRAGRAIEAGRVW
ncbi:aldehyde dehydrogenase family protein, partial [Klebsiella pneumoniae]|nr:aldehyde dehydrogenase family protein [Klebsiella pneumoniae]